MIRTPTNLSTNMMMYEICTLTDPGLVRKNNEDAVAFDVQSGLCLLADGMGGYNAGEVAAAMAITFIDAELGRWLTDAGRKPSTRELRRAMEICVENANHSIFNAAHANRQYAGMGTTLVVGVFQDNRLMLGHIGDSRCYRLRGTELLQITKDHSFLQEQLDGGLISAAEARVSLNKNLITRALGVEGAVLLEANEHCVVSGDLYLMCSDGLSDMVSHEEIAAILRDAQPLEHKASQLIAAANACGGRDNISVVLAHASEAWTQRGMLSRMMGK